MNKSNFDRPYLLTTTKAQLQQYRAKLNEYLIYCKENNINGTYLIKNFPKMCINTNGFIHKCAYLKMEIITIEKEKKNNYRVYIRIKTIRNKTIKYINSDIVLYLTDEDLININNGKIHYLYGIVNIGSGEKSKSLFYINEFGLFTNDLFSEDSNYSDILTNLGSVIFEDDNFIFDNEYNKYNTLNSVSIYYKDFKESFKINDNKYLSVQTIEDFTKNEYDKKLLDEINHDIDLVEQIEYSKIYKSSNGSITESKNQGLRLREKNEHKIYLLCGNRVIKTPYFRIKPSLEKSYIKVFDKSLIEIVNNRLKEISREFGGNDEIIILKRFNLRPEVINNEKKPNGVRTTVTAFTLIDSNTHQFKTEDIFYEDLSISCFKNPFYKERK